MKQQAYNDITHFPAPGQCPFDDSEAGEGGRAEDQDQRPQLPGYGITTYLQNGGKLEIAQHMAGHESARTTGLYDRRSDEVTLDEVERIAY